MGKKAADAMTKLRLELSRLTALDKLLAGLGKKGQPDLLDFKPANLKGLIPTTSSDTLPANVA